MADAIKTRTVMIDGLSVETTDAGAQALEKLMKDATDAKADHATAIATKDAALATKDAEITALKAKIVDGAALDKLAADRAGLIGKAKAVAPELVTDGKSAAEIRKAAVVAKNGAAMADKSDAYIDAMFDILVADAAKNADPAARALAGGQTVLTDADTLYEARSKALADAWKPQSKKEAV